MAFGVQVIVGSTTQSLSDGNPFVLRRASGMAGPAVRRVTTQGPAQHGDTDWGYRLEPREMELVVGFKATTDALLDARRDTLVGLFKPLSATPIKLRVTRDDGEVRQIDCYTIGGITLDLAPEHRPGHYHEATIRLRAADPAWYEPATGTVTVTGTAGIAADWWLAGGAIGTVQVRMSGGTPALGAAWSYTGTIPSTVSHTLAFRSAKVTIGNSLAFGVDNNASGFFDDVSDVYFGMPNFGGYYEYDGLNLGSAAMEAGTLNYFCVYYPGVSPSLGDISIYRTYPFSYEDVSIISSAKRTTSITGTARKWRTSTTGGTGWPETISLYALYSPALGDSQMKALNVYMAGIVGGTVAQAIAIPYEGDLPDYPTISITGPITNASILNTATGNELSFGTVAIAAGSTYVINTHPAYTTIVQGVTSKRGDLTAASDLGEWRLEPAPVATGGTNVIAVTGTSASAATAITIVYTNRYMSF